MSIAIAFLRSLANTVGRLGIDQAEFLRAIGIEDTSSAEDFIPSMRVERSLAQLARRLGDENFGLTLAKASPMGSLSTFDYAVWASKDLRTALARASRLYESICRGVILDNEHDERLGRLWMKLPPEAPSADVLIELTIAIFVTRIREALGGELRLREIHFRGASRTVAAYQSFFGVTPLFEQPVDGLVFDATHLDKPLFTADERTAGVLEARALELIATLRNTDDLLDTVRAAIVRGLPRGDIELERIAHLLATSTRSLQRQLQERGTSLRDVVDAVRHEVAIARLADPQVSTVALAHELGFATPQAFYRAFSRWTGTTPASYRAARSGKG